MKLSFRQKLQVIKAYKESGGKDPLYSVLSKFENGGDLPEKSPTIVDNKLEDDNLVGMMKARMAMASQFGNTSAQRMTSVSPKTYQFTGNEQINGEYIGVPKGEVGTHFMSSMDNYAVPFIQERDGNMQFISNPSYKDSEAIKFDRPYDAEYFAEHYKEVAPMMQSFATGGELPEDPPVTNLSKYIRDTSSSNDNTNYKSVPLRKGEPPIIGGTLPTVEIKASNTPKNYRNDPISRREDIKKVPITKSNMHDYPVSIQTEFMKQQVADRPGYEAIRDFANFAATGFGLAPIGIVDYIVNTAVGTGTKYLPKIVNRVGKLDRFKSEINWGNWNKEIPSNKPLMDEYLQIEKTAKQNGTWMKNPDGSTFNGTPEQFVQQNSSNFKKAYPEGFDEVARGVNRKDSKFLDNRSMFTADKNLAGSSYTPSDKKFNILTYNSPPNEGGVHHLYKKSSNNSIEFDARGSYWDNIDMNRTALHPNTIKNNIKELEQSILNINTQILKRTKSNVDVNNDFVLDALNNKLNKLNLDLKYNTETLSNIEKLNESSPQFLEMREFLGNTTTTKKIAKYIEDKNLDYVKLINIDDAGIGDVSIVNNKPNNYLKSMFGNNGMFDMTNPNIYKSVIPVLGTSYIGNKFIKNNNND